MNCKHTFVYTYNMLILVFKAPDVIINKIIVVVVKSCYYAIQL